MGPTGQQPIVSSGSPVGSGPVETGDIILAPSGQGAGEGRDWKKIAVIAGAIVVAAGICTGIAVFFTNQRKAAIVAEATASVSAAFGEYREYVLGEGEFAEYDATVSYAVDQALEAEEEATRIDYFDSLAKEYAKVTEAYQGKDLGEAGELIEKNAEDVKFFDALMAVKLLTKGEIVEKYAADGETAARNMISARYKGLAEVGGLAASSYVEYAEALGNMILEQAEGLVSAGCVTNGSYDAGCAIDAGMSEEEAEKMEGIRNNLSSVTVAARNRLVIRCWEIPGALSDLTGGSK